MTNPATRTIPVVIWNVLQETGASRAPVIAELVSAAIGRHVSPESVRVHLAALVKEGKLVRPAYGLYCLAERAPKPVDLQQWIAGELQRVWPGAPDAGTLRKQFLKINRYSVSLEQVEWHLALLERAGLADHRPGGAYYWTGASTAARSPIPTEGIFA